MNKVIEEIIEALPELPQHFGFNHYEDYYDYISDLNALLKKKITNEKIEMYYGLSKCAIVISNCDEVIKIPFNGQLLNDEDNNELYWEDFFYAGTNIEDDINNSWDYCEAELIRYELAAEAGLEQFFAKTRLLTHKAGFPLYTQEKCVTFRNGYRMGSESARKTIKKIREKNAFFGSGIDINWISCAIDYYGIEKVERLLQYLDKNDISDLHDNNIGFSEKDGRPVLIDFSDYYD